MKLDYRYRFSTRLDPDGKWFYFGYYSSRCYGLKVIEERLKKLNLKTCYVLVERYAFGCKDDNYYRYFTIEV